ncbi:MAG TPA: hypothetical protein VNH11_13115 [Pirellulales bacterium]|nr:hypothetical protein [Pirellulales bacterium]
MGDHWLITWGDDDALYTAYGDGRGFEPFVDVKLSLGLAKINGGPDGFTAVNRRSSTCEQRGDGVEGKKASGLLTTAYFAEKWDVAPGETAGIPTKWMSADGLTFFTRSFPAKIAFPCGGPPCRFLKAGCTSISWRT